MGQVRMPRYPIAGWLHALIFWGFLVLLLRSLMLWGRGYDETFSLWILGDNWLGWLYSIAKDVVAVIVWLAAGAFFVYRLVYRKTEAKRMSHHWEAYLILLIIFVMMMADVLYDGANIIHHNREEGLAYSVYSSTATGSEQGYYLAYIGTSPSTREQALEGFIREMELMKKDVTDEEVERAITSIVSGHKLALQGNSALVTNFGGHAVLGMQPDYDEQLLEKIKGVTKEMVMECASKYLDTSKYVLVRSGKLDAQQIRRMERD